MACFFCLCKNKEMKIQNNFINKSSIIRPTKRITQQILSKTKTIVGDCNKKAGFMKTPIKYYLIGLALPIPFASTVGFVIGVGKSVYDRISQSYKNKKTS